MWNVQYFLRMHDSFFCKSRFNINFLRHQIQCMRIFFLCVAFSSKYSTRTLISIVNCRFYSLSTHKAKRRKNWYFLKRVYKNIIYVMCFYSINWNKCKETTRKKQITSIDAFLLTLLFDRLFVFVKPMKVQRIFFYESVVCVSKTQHNK